MNLEDILPDKLYLNDFGGDFKEYLEAVYAVFKKDFVDSRPTFEGVRLGLKKYPIQFDKEYTFYHFTHNGKDENNREPDLRRMESIGFPRPMIDNSHLKELRVWRNIRGRAKRILIYCEKERYLVVLDDRGDFILPWTTYHIEYNNQNRKLIREYEEYINAKTA